MDLSTISTKISESRYTFIWDYVVSQLLWVAAGLAALDSL
jgi:hypothetical protein